MKLGYALIASLLLIAPAQAQYSTSNPVPRYGETDKERSQSDIEAEKKAERDYKRSSGNIPTVKQTDPWGGVREEPPKATPAKTAKQKAP